MELLKQQNFNELVNQICQTHDALKSNALKAINVSLTIRNWLFGCYIVEYEQNGADKAKYGENLIDELSESLEKKGLKGVAPTPLRLCRSFYITYSQIQQTVSVKLQALGIKQIQPTASVELQNTENQLFVAPIKLITNLSFSHFSELLKIDDPLKRAFYEIECIKGTWSVRELRRQINSLF